jgi:hypothetical protein
MPFGDSTGPLGQGPGTGRRRGRCAGLVDIGPQRRGGGFFGRGPGSRRGWRDCFPAVAGPPAAVRPPDTAAAPENELGALKEKADAFERALEDIRKRIEGLEAQRA